MISHDYEIEDTDESDTMTVRAGTRMQSNNRQPTGTTDNDDNMER